MDASEEGQAELLQQWQVCYACLLLLEKVLKTVPAQVSPHICPQSSAARPLTVIVQRTVAGGCAQPRPADACRSHGEQMCQVHATYGSHCLHCCYTTTCG
jgi:hypothetical protein